MARRIKPEQLGNEINKIMKEYSKMTAEGLKEAVDSVTKEAVKMTKARANVRTGRYRKGWRARKTGDSAYSLQKTVYNARPSLPHLLENPRRARGPDLERKGIFKGRRRGSAFTRDHALRGGGRIGAGNMIPGNPHIRPAEQWAINEIERRIKGRIQG